MSTTTTRTATTTAPAVRSHRWVLFGMANVAVVTILSVATWYLLADPQISPWHFYPLPFNAALFWALMFIVWIGFNCEFAGFDRLGQPARGCAILAATTVFAVTLTWLLAHGLGRLYPDFAADRPLGLGYFAGALFCLFGFGMYVMSVLNWKHWPWKAMGFRQPLVGLCEIAFLAVPALALYLVLGLPSVSLSATPLMSVNTVLGWFYTCVVSVVLTGQTLDNWPWRLFGEDRNPRAVAIAATVGNVALGTAMYFLMLPLIKLLVGSAAVNDPSALAQFPAQLGVCWAVWMVFWANAFGNKPTRFTDGVNLLLRAVLTFALAVVTFLVYYKFAAEHILHEPAIPGNLHGNALGFIDWVFLWLLFYVVGFQSYGLRKWAPAEG